ncbi:MAG: MFS transporter [Mariniblastus sp.]|nr:MFS transporter [Mariniblastus sp.]
MGKSRWVNPNCLEKGRSFGLFLTAEWIRLELGDNLTSKELIVFECPKCLGIIKSSRESAGQRIACPDCGVSLIVPVLGSTGGGFDDLFGEAATHGGSSPEKETGPVSDDGPLPFGSEDSSFDNLEHPEVEGVEFEVSAATASEVGGEPVSKELPEILNEVLGDDISNDAFDSELAFEIEPPDPPIKSEDAKDPFLEDADAPIKIDGLEMDVDSDQVFGVTCSICDTRIHVGYDQVGGKVSCPICYSEVEVTEPVNRPESKKPWAMPSQKPEATADELTLEAPVDRPQADYGIEPGYGLAPVDEDLLTPIELPEDEIVDLEILEDVPQSPEVSSSSMPIPSLVDDGSFSLLDVEPLESSPSASTKQVPGPAVTESSKTEHRVESDKDPGGRWRQVDDRRDGSSATQSKDSTPSPSPERGVRWKPVVGWMTQVFKSPQLVIRTLISIGSFAVGYWFFDSFHATWGDNEMDSTSRIVGLLFSGFMGTLFWIPSALLFSITFAILFRDSVEEDPKVDQWPGAGFSEWFGSFAFVAFSFWIASLPGILLGNVLYMMTDTMIFLLLLVPLSVFLILPICLVNALFNESILNIVSADVMKSIPRQKTKWLDFYKVNLILLGIFTSGTLFLYLPTILFSFLGTVLQVVGALGLAAALGLHTRKVLDEIDQHG